MSNVIGAKGLIKFNEKLQKTLKATSAHGNKNIN